MSDAERIASILGEASATYDEGICWQRDEGDEGWLIDLEYEREHCELTITDSAPAEITYLLIGYAVVHDIPFKVS